MNEQNPAVSNQRSLSIVNYENVHPALQYFKSDDATWERIKKDFPDQLADLVSWKENPNCQCGQRLLKFFNELLNVYPSALDKYVLDENKFNSALVKQIESQRNNLLAGKIIEVDKGEAAWHKLFESLEGKQFMAFSAVEREDKVVVYFL